MNIMTILQKSHRVGPLDYFWTIFLDHFFGPIFGPFYRGEGRPSVPREGWDAVNQYSGRDGRQTVFTEIRAEEQLLVRMVGWEVDVLVAELAERSPITIRNSSNPSSPKNLVVRPYDLPYNVQLLACVANCTTGTILAIA